MNRSLKKKKHDTEEKCLSFATTDAQSPRWIISFRQNSRLSCRRLQMKNFTQGSEELKGKKSLKEEAIMTVS